MIKRLRHYLSTGKSGDDCLEELLLAHLDCFDLSVLCGEGKRPVSGAVVDSALYFAAQKPYPTDELDYIRRIAVAHRGNS